MANAAKTAIVTGASRGIGAGLVEAFLKRGYNLVANSRSITKANPFSTAANVALVDGDIGDPRTAAKIVDTAVSRFGRIDVLVNNAGVFIPKPFTEYTAEDFNTLVSTTLAGFLYVSQLSIKQMVRQKSGSILNVSTTLVDQPVAGVGAAVQIMAKGALHAVTRALAIEYAKEGIRVNTVALGVINTPMHKPETHDFLKGLHPVGRIGEVKEVVDAMLFLTDATFTSGEILHVDGGAHAGKWWPERFVAASRAAVHEETEISATLRETFAGSRRSRGQEFVSKRLVLAAIRVFVSVNLLYAAIFLKFAGVPGSVTLFTQMSKAAHGLVSQPVFRLGSGVFETVVAVLLLIPKTARLGAALTVGWMTGVGLSHIFV